MTKINEVMPSPSHPRSMIIIWGIKINKFDAVDDLIQDIRNRNAESIKKSGEVLWNKTETEQNDKLKSIGRICE